MVQCSATIAIHLVRVYAFGDCVTQSFMVTSECREISSGISLSLSLAHGFCSYL